MKLGLKTIVLAVVVALLCVPAAFAKGGHEGGHGHGKPSWAGQGKSHEKKTKLAKAHATKAKHEKHQKAQVQADGDQELNLEDLNPAWQCFMVESMMDAQDAEALASGGQAGEFSSFDVEFGTNDNKRNSHGKCVSEAAHAGDVSAALGDEQEQSCDEPADDGSEDPATEEGSQDAAAEDGSEDPAAEDGSEDPAAADGTGDATTEEGSDEPVADGPADDGSGDQAGEAANCESDDSAGEDDQAGEGDQGDETEVAAFARALVRFVKL
jgi:hypothetical protein